MSDEQQPDHYRNARQKIQAELDKDPCLKAIYDHGWAADEDALHKDIDEERRTYHIPKSIPKTGFDTFEKVRFLSNLGLPSWATDDQGFFALTSDDTKKLRKRLVLPPDTPDEYVVKREPNREPLDFILSHMPLPKPTRPEEILAWDRKQLHLPADAKPQTIYKALLAQDARLQRESVGLPAGEMLSPAELQAEKVRVNKAASDAFIREMIKLPDSYPDKEVEEIQDKWNKFDEKYRVQVVHLSATHKVIYSYSPNLHAEVKIGEFDVPRNHFSTAEKLVTAWIAQKKTELSQQFAVKFTAPGQPPQDYAHNVVPSKDNVKGSPFPISVEPNVTELVGLESALHRLATKDAKTLKTGLEITFLGQSDGRYTAYYAVGKTRVYFEAACKESAATETELQKGGEYSSRPDSMEAIATHEFAHYTQDLQDLFSKGPAATSFRSRMHWAAIKPNCVDNAGWVLEGNDGNTYKFDDSSKEWLKTDKEGNLLDVHNQPTKEPKNAIHLSNEQMDRLAIEKPATDYFEHPQEMDAEALMEYRLGGYTRKQLLKTNPELYKFAKAEDQQYINTTYGTAQNGAPRYIRTVDGSIVPNTHDVRASIAYFEDRINKTVNCH